MKTLGTILSALVVAGHSAVANPIILNPTAAMQPVGTLTINGESASGYITGVDLPENTLAVAVDDFNRGFAVYLNDSVHNYDTFNSTTDLSGLKYSLSDNVLLHAKSLKEWTLRTRMSNDYFTYDVYLKTRHRHPFMSFGGSYGDMKLNAIVDNVFTFGATEGWNTKVGAMATKTFFDKGLIQDIDVQVGAWGELEYKENGFSLATGVYPVGISGNVKMRFPHMQNPDTGDLYYTTQSYAPTRHIERYIRADYSFKIGDGDVSLGLFAKSSEDWKKVNFYNTISYSIKF